MNVNGYEIGLASGYIAAVARATPRRSTRARSIIQWLRDCAEDVGLTGWDAHLGGDGEDGFRRGRYHCDFRPGVAYPSPELWQAAGAALKAWGDRHPRCRPDAIAHNIEALAALFDLSDLERAFVRLVLTHRRRPEFEGFVSAICLLDNGLDENCRRVLAAMLGCDAGAVRRILSPTGRLAAAGVAWVRFSEDHRAFLFDLAGGLYPALTEGRTTPKALRLRLTGRATVADLSWEDFDHIGRARDTALKILEGALARRARGINILVYGPPGTGKTEFCKVLAARMGAELFPVAENRGVDIEPSRDDRLTALKIMQRLLAGDGRCLLLFDEMEDAVGDPLLALISPRAGHQGSRVHQHRQLEINPVPVLWTCNEIAWFDPARLRRMTFAIQIKAPPPAIRERVWHRVLKRERLSVPPQQVRALAREFDAPPSLAAGAALAARLSGNDVEVLAETVSAIATAMRGGHERPPRVEAPAPFAPELAVCDLDPVTLAERLADQGARRFSLCLSGPPGTGKSAFARHLAERIGIEVVQKRTSDLLSPWLGESEAAIAAAFAEAREAGAMLVFDEADSLLGDRAAARARWEVSQVNEMLTWMEFHPLPFACTTNLKARLDPASLRRFTFKLEFGPLDRSRALAAFRMFFGLEPPPGMERLAGLTPGDFAVVRRKAEILGTLDDPGALLAMLNDECAAKPDAPRPIGFMMG